MKVTNQILLKIILLIISVLLFISILLSFLFTQATIYQLNIENFSIVLRFISLIFICFTAILTYAVKQILNKIAYKYKKTFIFCIYLVALFLYFYNMILKF